MLWQPTRKVISSIVFLYIWCGIIGVELDITSPCNIWQVTVMLDFCKINCHPSWRTFFSEHDYRCTASMTMHPISHCKRHALSKWATPWPMDRPWRSAELATAVAGYQSARIHVCGYMKNMVYERMVGTKDELFQRIFVAARRVNDVTFLRKVTLSTVERCRMCIRADGGHFEHF
jgi:hypothetical protein